MRGAYLEVMGDFAGSAAVIVAAIVIAVTGWTPADAVASVLDRPSDHAAHLGDSCATRSTSCSRRRPRGWTSTRSGRTSSRPTGVADIHDLHAWTITSGMNVLSAHVVLDEGATAPAVLDELCRCLSGDFDIEHSTFQLESSDRTRLEEASHR